MIVIGYLNADIVRLQNLRIQQVAKFLVYFGLVNLLSHFRQLLRFCHMNTWWKFQQDKFLYLCCDYILGSDHQIFETVGIIDPRNFASDNFALRAQFLYIPT